jgi:hypothetical protein
MKLTCYPPLYRSLLKASILLWIAINTSAAATATCDQRKSDLTTIQLEQAKLKGGEPLKSLFEMQKEHDAEMAKLLILEGLTEINSSYQSFLKENFSDEEFPTAYDFDQSAAEVTDFEKANTFELTAREKALPEAERPRGDLSKLREIYGAAYNAILLDDKENPKTTLTAAEHAKIENLRIAFAAKVKEFAERKVLGDPKGRLEVTRPEELKNEKKVEELTEGYLKVTQEFAGKSAKARYNNFRLKLKKFEEDAKAVGKMASMNQMLSSLQSEIVRMEPEKAILDSAKGIKSEFYYFQTTGNQEEARDRYYTHLVSKCGKQMSEKNKILCNHLTGSGEDAKNVQTSVKAFLLLLKKSAMSGVDDPSTKDIVEWKPSWNDSWRNDVEAYQNILTTSLPADLGADKIYENPEFKEFQSAVKSQVVVMEAELVEYNKCQKNYYLGIGNGCELSDKAHRAAEGIKQRGANFINGVSKGAFSMDIPDLNRGVLRGIAYGKNEMSLLDFSRGIRNTSTNDSYSSKVVSGNNALTLRFIDARGLSAGNKSIYGKFTDILKNPAWSRLKIGEGLTSDKFYGKKDDRTENDKMLFAFNKIQEIKNLLCKEAKNAECANWKIFEKSADGKTSVGADLGKFLELMTSSKAPKALMAAQKEKLALIQKDIKGIYDNKLFKDLERLKQLAITELTSESCKNSLKRSESPGCYGAGRKTPTVFNLLDSADQILGEINSYKDKALADAEKPGLAKTCYMISAQKKELNDFCKKFGDKVDPGPLANGPEIDPTTGRKIASPGSLGDDDDGDGEYIPYWKRRNTKESEDEVTGVKKFVSKRKTTYGQSWGFMNLPVIGKSGNYQFGNSLGGNFLSPTGSYLPPANYSNGIQMGFGGTIVGF